MKLSLETLARTYAAGRNYINLGLGFATSAGVISVAQDKSLTDSFNEIYQGVSLIVHGTTSIWQVLVVVGGPIVGGILAWYAQRSAKTATQAAAVTAAVVDPATPVSVEAKTSVLKAAATIAAADPVLAASVAKAA